MTPPRAPLLTSISLTSYLLDQMDEMVTTAQHVPPLLLGIIIVVSNATKAKPLLSADLLPRISKPRQNSHQSQIAPPKTVLRDPQDFLVQLRAAQPSLVASVHAVTAAFLVSLL